MSPAISPNVFKNACGIECCFQLSSFLWLWLTHAHARTHTQTRTHTHMEPYIFANENIAFIKWVMHFVNWIQAYNWCWVTDVLMDGWRLLFPPVPPSHRRGPHPRSCAERLQQTHEGKKVKSTDKTLFWWCLCEYVWNLNVKLKTVRVFTCMLELDDICTIYVCGVCQDFICSHVDLLFKWGAGSKEQQGSTVYIETLHRIGPKAFVGRKTRQKITALVVRLSAAAQPADPRLQVLALNVFLLCKLFCCPIAEEQAPTGKRHQLSSLHTNEKEPWIASYRHVKQKPRREVGNVVVHYVAPLQRDCKQKVLFVDLLRVFGVQKSWNTCTLKFVARGFIKNVCKEPSPVDPFASQSRSCPLHLHFALQRHRHDHKQAVSADLLIFSIPPHPNWPKQILALHSWGACVVCQWLADIKQGQKNSLILVCISSSSTGV